MRGLLIGISGKMGCGKSTLAGLLAERLQPSVRLSMADALREEVSQFFGFTGELTPYSEAFKSSIFQVGHRLMQGREILQEWGSLRRAGDRDYWVHRAWDRVLGVRESQSGVFTTIIFDDIRYLNELAMIWQAPQYATIRLDPYPGWTPGPMANHLSELALDGATFDLRMAPEYGKLADVADEICHEIGHWRTGELPGLTSGS